MKALPLLLVTLFVVTFSSCKKDNLVDATITGYDLRMCACCGGLYATVGTQNFRATDIVDNSVINNNSVFPLKVRIEFTENPMYCGEPNTIKITKIEKQ